MNVKIKLCGMFREKDIDYVNELMPDYVGFIINFSKSHRSIDAQTAMKLKEKLSKKIKAVGVFVNEKPEVITDIVNRQIISVVQLHGSEDENYIKSLRKNCNAEIIKAFTVKTLKDIEKANNSSADFVLLDSGAGTGTTFDHSLIKGISRPYFLAGGLTDKNVATAIDNLRPFAVDASSSLETNKIKDINKMTSFVKAVRKG